MKTIIAPTDFSAISLNAVNYAADMAVDINASLLLLHVAELISHTIPELPVSDVTYFQVSREAELAELKENLLRRTHNAIEVNTRHLVGNITHEVKEACEELHPFAVVMGTHLPRTLERFLFGSVTLHAVTHLPYPVIVVPENATYKPFRNIALATDLKGIYHIPVEQVESLAKLYNAKLHVVHVALQNEPHAESYAEKTLLQHRLKRCDAHFHFVVDTCIEKGIEKFALQNNIDLLLLLPKKHNPFHKSQSKQVIFHLPVPAMAIHEEEIS